MQLINLLNIPAKYRSRYSKVKNVIMSDFEIVLTDSYRIFKTNTGYITQIAFNISEQIRPTSEIFVDCQCKSFQFEFAETLKRHKGLLLPENYINAEHKKNITTISGCKHLIYFAKYIFERRSIFDRKL
jgi:hypothetical protein